MAVPRFQVMEVLFRSALPPPALPLRSAEVTLESLPELWTEVRLPFSAVLHRPLGRIIMEEAPEEITPAVVEEEAEEADEAADEGGGV